MVDKTYPLLCGGAFFNLIIKALKPKASASQHWDGANDGLDDQSVLIALVNIFVKGYVSGKSSSFKTQTSEYKNCKKAGGVNLPFGDVALVSNFDEQIKSSYSIPLKSMNEFVVNFLNKDKYQWLAKALLDFIRIDDDIDKTVDLYCAESGQTIKKEDLIKSTTVCLPALLLGIWHYIIMYRSDNNSGDTKLDMKTIGQPITQQIEILMPKLIEPAMSEAEENFTNASEPLYEGNAYTQDEPYVNAGYSEATPNGTTQILYQGTPITVIAQNEGVGIGVNTAPITINNK